MAAEKLTKKQKKASEFRNKKRKIDETDIPDVPEEDTPENEQKALDKEKAANKKPKAVAKNAQLSETAGSTDAKEGSAEETSALDNKRKRRRGKGKGTESEIKEGEEGVVGAATTPAPKPTPKNQKFIVFVGNLSYATTKEQLEKHFESCGKITSVRVQTDKVTGKGKGFAFMEFGEPEAMQKALYFNKTLIKDRPINVELTAGGGGNKSAARKQKIAEKNTALNEERRKVHEKHIAPAKEAKSSYAAAHPPVVQKAPPKNIKRPQEMSDANAIQVEGLASRLRKH